MLSDTDLAEAIKQARATPGVAYVIPLDDEYVATVAIVKRPPPKLPSQEAIARVRDAVENGSLDELRELHRNGDLHSQQRSLLHDAFGFACRRGHLAIAQWFHETFKLTPEEVRSFDNYALHTACVYRKLDVARWLVETFGLTAADARINNNAIFRAVCIFGHIEAARWLYETFKLTPEDARACDGEALKRARENNKRDIVAWLENEVFASPKPMSEELRQSVFTACRFGAVSRLRELHAAKELTVDVVVECSALYTACEYNKRDVAEWLVATFPSLLKTPLEVLLPTLETICARGNMDVLEWFPKTFPIVTRAHFVSDNNKTGCRALQEACANGYLETAKRLTEHYGLTAENARALDNQALCKACGSKGGSPLVRWFHERFSLSIAEVKAAVDWAGRYDGSVLREVVDWVRDIEMFDNVKALRAACSSETPEDLVKAMHTDGRLTLQVVRAADALSIACIHGHLWIAHWLRQKFKLDAEDARRSLAETIKGASANGHAEAIRWIVDMAKLDTAAANLDTAAAK